MLKLVSLVFTSHIKAMRQVETLVGSVGMLEVPG